MTGKSPIEFAKAYVAASNAHDVTTIEPMLSADCKYISSGVGEHSGREAIAEMMTGFFAQNPEVRWEGRNWALAGPHTVMFDFTITLPSGSFDGRESVTIDASGAITEIRVDR